MVDCFLYHEANAQYSSVIEFLITLADEVLESDKAVKALEADAFPPAPPAPTGDASKEEAEAAWAFTFTGAPVAPIAEEVEVLDDDLDEAVETTVPATKLAPATRAKSKPPAAAASKPPAAAAAASKPPAASSDGPAPPKTALPVKPAPPKTAPPKRTAAAAAAASKSIADGPTPPRTAPPPKITKVKSAQASSSGARQPNQGLQAPADGAPQPNQDDAQPARHIAPAWASSEPNLTSWDEMLARMEATANPSCPQCNPSMQFDDRRQFDSHPQLSFVIYAIHICGRSLCQVDEVARAELYLLAQHSKEGYEQASSHTSISTVSTRWSIVISTR